MGVQRFELTIPSPLLLWKCEEIIERKMLGSDTDIPRITAQPAPYTISTSCFAESDQALVVKP